MLQAYRRYVLMLALVICVGGLSGCGGGMGGSNAQADPGLDAAAGTNNDLTISR